MNIFPSRVKQRIYPIVHNQIEKCYRQLQSLILTPPSLLPLQHKPVAPPIDPRAIEPGQLLN